jgi:tetratricopeptide (TPR) repeat protein
MEWRKRVFRLRNRSAEEWPAHSGAIGRFVPSRETVVPLVSLFAVLAILSTLAGVVAQAYRSQKQRRGSVYFQQGQSLSAQGQFAVAVERYRAALSFSRENPDYKLALASALVRLGRPREAQAHLTDLLHVDPTSGIVNLLMARLLESSRRDEAEGYYNRAIYGYWPPEQEAERGNARFALIRLLLQAGENRKAVGQMMQAQAELPDDPAAQKRLGALFLQAGDSVEAANTFRRIIRAHPSDTDAYAGLGEAELRNQKYTVARAAFSYATKLDPSNRALRDRYRFADEISRLDPTVPRLMAAERFARTRTLLGRVIDEVESCGNGSQPSDSSMVALLQMAREAVRHGRGKRDYSDAAEANLTLVEEVVNARTRVCGRGQDLSKPLAFVVAKLSAAENAEPAPSGVAGAVSP